MRRGVLVINIFQILLNISIYFLGHMMLFTQKLPVDSPVVEQSLIISFMYFWIPYFVFFAYVYALEYLNKYSTKIIKKITIVYAVVSTIVLLTLVVPYLIAVDQNIQVEIESKRSNLLASLIQPSEIHPLSYHGCQIVMTREYDMDPNDRGNNQYIYIGNISSFGVNLNNVSIAASNEEDYKLNLQLHKTINGLMRYFINVDSNYNQPNFYEYIEQNLIFGSPYKPASVSCFDDLRKLFWFILFPQCNNICDSMKLCNSRCLTAKNSCGDLLNIVHFDSKYKFYDYGGSDIVETFGLHNMYYGVNSINSFGGLSDPTYGIPNEGFDIIKRVMPLIYGYSCNNDILFSTAEDDCPTTYTGSETSHNHINGSCTWSSKIQYESELRNYRQEFKTYEKLNDQLPTTLNQMIFEIYSKYSNKIKIDAYDSLTFFVWFISIEMVYLLTFWKMRLVCYKFQSNVNKNMKPNFNTNALEPTTTTTTTTTSKTIIKDTAASRVITPYKSEKTVMKQKKNKVVPHKHLANIKSEAIVTISPVSIIDHLKGGMDLFINSSGASAAIVPDAKAETPSKSLENRMNSRTLGSKLKFSQLLSKTANLIAFVSVIYVILVCFVLFYLLHYSIMEWYLYAALLIVISYSTNRLILSVLKFHQYGVKYIGSLQITSVEEEELMGKNHIPLVETTATLTTTTPLLLSKKLYLGFKKLKKSYRKWFSLKHGGKFGYLRMFAFKVLEIALQCASLNTLVGRLGASALTLFVAILTLDCWCFSILFMVVQTEKFTIEKYYMFSVLFELFYIVLNISLRWGLVEELGWTFVLSMIEPFYFIHKKLVSTLHINVAKSCSNYIRNEVGDLDGIRVMTKDNMRMMTASTTTATTTTTIRRKPEGKKSQPHRRAKLDNKINPANDSKRVQNHLQITPGLSLTASNKKMNNNTKTITTKQTTTASSIRTDNGVHNKHINAIELATQNYDTHSSLVVTLKVETCVAFLSAVALIFIGAGVSGVTLLRLFSKSTYCEELYGKCVWNGIEPKIYFHSGLFGELDCGELSMERITARDCDLNAIPSTLIIGSKSNFPQLNQIDLSNTNISSIPPWLLEIETLTLDNTPCSIHPELIISGSNPQLSSLHENYSNVFGGTATTIDLSGHAFTSFDFNTIESKFPNLETIDLSSNNLTRLMNLESFMASQSTIISLYHSNQNNDYNNYMINLMLGHNCIDLNENEAGILSELIRYSVVKQLSTLDLSFNCIQELPTQFLYMFKHVELKLHHNPIKSLVLDQSECDYVMNTVDFSNSYSDNNIVPEWVSHLNDIEMLQLSSCDITDTSALNQDIYFRKITSLKLYENSLTSIAVLHPSSVSLIHLDLMSNNIQKIDSFALEKLHSLEDLDLGANDIDSIPNHTFKSQTLLRNLYLYANEIGALSAESFTGLQSLERLLLYYNQIPTLPAKIFSNSTSLTTIDLYSNKIDELLPHTFDGLVHLQTLNMGSNNIGENSFEEDIFRDLIALKYLHIGRNNLKVLPSNKILHNSLYLEKIRFHDNNLKSIPNGIFSQLLSLKNVALQENALEKLPDMMFNKDVCALEYLRIDTNYISELPSSGNIFHCETSLKKLYMHNNLIELIPPGSFKDLVSLEILYLTNNRIYTLEDDLMRNMTNLTDFGFTNNFVSSISENFFDPCRDSIVYISFSDNNIELVANNTFSNSPFLQTLNLQENDIQWVANGAFSGLISIQNLVLDKNNIKKLHPGIFSDLHELFYLNLELNLIEELYPGLFKDLAKVRYLFLGHNQIRFLPEDIFRGLYHLLELELEDNQIISLPVNLFKDLGQLRYLDLSKNTLLNIPNSVFNPLISLEELEITVIGNQANTSPLLFQNLTALKQVVLHGGSPDLQCNHFLFANDNCDCSNV